VISVSYRVFLAGDVREKWDELIYRLKGCDLVIINGDILNLFPSLGSPLAGSVVYELDKNMTQRALLDFADYKQRTSDGSYFRDFLKTMFFGGEYYVKLVDTIEQRLEKGFSILKKDEKKIVIIPGNLDFPQIVRKYCALFDFEYLDNSRTLEFNGKFVSGVGGIPDISNPVNGEFKFFPYEKNRDEYFKEFSSGTEKSDLLVTHLGADFFMNDNNAQSLRERFQKGHARTLVLSSDDRPHKFAETIGKKKILWPGSFETDLSGIFLKI